MSIFKRAPRAVYYARREIFVLPYTTCNNIMRHTHVITMSSKTIILIHLFRRREIEILLRQQQYFRYCVVYPAPTVIILYRVHYIIRYIAQFKVF